MFASTVAYISDIEGEKSRFAKKNGMWRDRHTAAVFSNENAFPAELEGVGKSDKGTGEVPRLSKLTGFDTFWYIWSTTHKDVVILE